MPSALARVPSLHFIDLYAILLLDKRSCSFVMLKVKLFVARQDRRLEMTTGLVTSVGLSPCKGRLNTWRIFVLAISVKLVDEVRLKSYKNKTLPSTFIISHPDYFHNSSRVCFL